MSEATHLDPGVSGFPLPPLWNRSIVLEDEAVNVSGISPKMVRFLHTCAELHEALFDEPLCLTNGKDCYRAPGSSHSRYKAVDVRSSDMDYAGRALFIACLEYIGRDRTMTIIDVVSPSSVGHIHIEEAG